ncbi:MAG TPA: hypothetical protein DEB06_10290 [Phycisphaerales bacterium]|nr:hypothetical protein [Phycisphaerales bacterium]
MKMSAIMGIVAVGLVSLCAAVSPTRAGVLKEGLEPVEPFIGTWEVRGQWSSGAALWARTRYEPALDGHFLAARTMVSEENGTIYERYASMIGRDTGTGVLPIHSFTHTGECRVLEFKHEGDGRFTTQWSMGESQVKELLALRGTDRKEWKVWTKGPADADWTLALDAEWKKIENNAPMDGPRQPLSDAMAPFAPMLGAWEVLTKWPDGVALWSLWKVDASQSGTSIRSTVLARDGDGQPYERYRTFFIRSADGDGFEEVTFTHTGQVLRAPATMTTGAVPVFESVTPAGAMGPVEFVKQYSFTSPDAFRWLVRAREPGTQAMHPVADAMWTRVSAPEGVLTAPIDDGLFVASGAPLRSLTKSAEIAAPVSRVFGAWATGEGWESVFAPAMPGSEASIELAIGGRYEWLFNGVLGSNGCQVLSYIPDRMLSFSWNTPPTQGANRMKRTWVVVEFAPTAAGGTAVTLIHLGFGEGAAWDESFAYFEKAWEFVLGRMKSVLEAQGK